MAASSSVQKLLVVGGNGFLGSAICKAAVSRGWEVSSMSSSGRPYQTPAGHTPAWVPRVQWHSASAFEPHTYSHLITPTTSVVHTLGILLEDTGYKASVRSGDVFGLAKSLISSLGLDLRGGQGNPLKSTEERKRGYEGMNRDSALTVLDTFLSTSASPSTPTSTLMPRSFVYISAADAFRPLVPSRYIETKREAELEIVRRCAATCPDPQTPDTRTQSGGVNPVLVRPGLMYHPHIRPLTTLPAFLVDLSAKLATATNLPNPFASKSPLHGTMEALRTYPLHVDHVASAVLKCIEEQREGVVDVNQMRDWAGLGRWKKEVGVAGQGQEQSQQL